MAEVVGHRLPEGKLSDKGADRVNFAIGSLLQLPAQDYDKPKAKTKLADLDDMAVYLDHTQNPGAYRICQDVVMHPDVVAALLRLSIVAQSDALRCKSLEVLLRTSFGNEAAANAIAANPDFLQAVGHSLDKSGAPQQMMALQLAQAVVASLSQDGSGTVVVPELLKRIPHFFSGASFSVLAEAALDIFVSSSFSFAADCAAALPPPLLAGLAAEDARRPAWLSLEPLNVLTCGLLTANMLASEGAGDESTRQSMLDDLSSGLFVEYFSCAMEAAASQTEWPCGSGAYHSPARLAKAVQNLTGLKFHRRLVAVVPQLARIVELSTDKHTDDAALVALRGLALDVECLEALIGLVDFRQDALRMLCDSGEHPEALELASFLLTIEDHFGAAQSALDASRAFMPNAPSVHQLAELFSCVGHLDEAVPIQNLLEAQRCVPIGPSVALQSSLSSGASRAFTFQEYARQVYGTPMLLGWWPSMMESARLWKEAEANMAGPCSYTLPSLAELVALFERGSEGKSTLSVQMLLDDLLPALRLPVESQAVEEAFVALRGTERLRLEVFAQWLAELFARLAQDERKAAAEEEPQRQAAAEN